VLSMTAQLTPTLLRRAVLRPWMVVVGLAGLMVGAGSVAQGRDLLARPRTLLVAVGASLVVVLGGAALTVDATTVADGDHGIPWFPRTWGDLIVLAAICVFLTACIAGRLLAARLGGSGQVYAAATSVALLGAATVLSVVQVTHLREDARLYAARAHGWDVQNHEILAEIKDGATRVVYRPKPLAGLVEPFAPDGHPTFATHCAEMYYQVQVISPQAASRL